MLYSDAITNTKRDLSDMFEVVRANMPLIVSQFAMAGPATHTKHEWLELQYTPVTTTLGGAATAGATTLTVADSTGFVKGDILRFESTTGAAYAETVKITTVTSTTVITVTRSHGAAAAGAIASSSIVVKMFTPQLQGTDAGDDAFTQHTAAYNYTQIFSRTAKITGTAEAMGGYGIPDPLNFAVAEHLDTLTRQLNNAIIYGERVAPATATAGELGGLLSYIVQTATGNVVVMSTTTTITSEKVNDAIQKIIEDGGTPNTLLCHTKQARKISAWNTSSVRTTLDTKVAGSYVQEFVSDLGFMPQAGIQKIFADPNMPQDKILCIDTRRIKLVPLKGRSWFDLDATTNGSDFMARRIIGEYTAEIKDALIAHGAITNMAV